MTDHSGETTPGRHAFRRDLGDGYGGVECRDCGLDADHEVHGGRTAEEGVGLQFGVKVNPDGSLQDDEPSAGDAATDVDSTAEDFYRRTHEADWDHEHHCGYVYFTDRTHEPVRQTQRTATVIYDINKAGIVIGVEIMAEGPNSPEPSADSGFYEDDEPIEDIKAILARPADGVTACRCAGWTVGGGNATCNDCGRVFGRVEPSAGSSPVTAGVPDTAAIRDRAGTSYNQWGDYEVEDLCDAVDALRSAVDAARGELVTARGERDEANDRTERFKRYNDEFVAMRAGLVAERDQALRDLATMTTDRDLWIERASAWNTDNVRRVDEADTLRGELAAANARLAAVEAQIAAQPSCGIVDRDHDGCYVADSLRIVREVRAGVPAAGDGEPTTTTVSPQPESHYGQSQRSRHPYCALSHPHSPSSRCAGLSPDRMAAGDDPQ